MKQVAGIYEQLNLGEFEQLREPLTRYLASQRDYQPNRHKLDDGLKAEIGRRWRPYIDRYGYARTLRESLVADAASVGEQTAP
jgi:hypothetical protein